MVFVYPRQLDCNAYLWTISFCLHVVSFSFSGAELRTIQLSSRGASNIVQCLQAVCSVNADNDDADNT